MVITLKYLKYRVVHLAASLGKKLINEHPEIAEYYRRGCSRKDIVHSLGIEENYEVSSRIAIGAVGLALSGYIGGVGIEKYDGLITDKNELTQLSRKHMEDSGVKAVSNRRGIHNLNEEKIAERETARFEALGYVQWSDEERDYIRKLLLKKELYYAKGKAKGKPNIDFLRRDLCARFQVERSNHAIRNEIWRIRHPK